MSELVSFVLGGLVGTAITLAWVRQKIARIDGSQ